MGNRVSSALAALPDRPHALYRFFDRTDVLLYVGITVDISARFPDHRTEKPWWTTVARIEMEHFGSRSEALAAEAEAIRTQKPLYNVMHNDMVAVTPADTDEEEGDEAHDLAITILGSLDLEDRQALLSDYRADFEGNQLSDRERDIGAASAALQVLWDYKTVLGHVSELMNILPGYPGPKYRKDALDEHEQVLGKGSYVSAASIARTALASYLGAVSVDYLGQLSADEASEWVARAQAAGRIAKPAAQRWAAQDHYHWAVHQLTMTGMCDGPGQHGARCPSRAERVVYFEVCPMCVSGCSGHERWCAAHTRDAVAGNLAFVADQPLALNAISRVAELPPQDSEPPF